MKKLFPNILMILILLMSSIGITNAFSYSNYSNENISTQDMSNGYGIQWMMEYGNSPWTGARYQGPQSPIG